MNTHVYNEYKLRQGYNAEEIFKTRSLAGVLEPFSIMVIMKCLKELALKILNIYIQICFKGWICIK